MRGVIVTIGFQKYLVYAVHLTNLMEIAAESPRMKMVEGHYDQYEIDADGDGFIEQMELRAIQVDNGITPDDGSSAAEPVVPAPHPSTKPFSDDDIVF